MLAKIEHLAFKNQAGRSKPRSIPKLQDLFAVSLTAADKEIEVLETKLAHFNQEKKALMQQLLMGKRRVKVDEEVVA
ncbi:hypothetical protein [Shewanella sp. Isolate7]|uniref:hypothetical protein n=1 Tax=Shewanella sp. Isolate7 TaxID=2908528 RepID=UPI001EFD68D7|nr:hypothetical protein [Shewanella sp. Isolate7]MCG9721483.1 hypothetical protein [Shewanella sp. Isolate7]